MASSLETILNAYNDKIVANKLGEEQRFLIFSIERHPVRAGSLLVGGLADRLKGIMTAFYGAVLTGRRFALHWETPLPLERNLQPSRYDWKFKNTVKFLPKDEPIQHYDFIDQSQIFDDIHHTNMETDLFRDNQIVIVNINSYRVQSLKPYFEEVTGAPISYNAFFTTGFRFLFQFNEKEAFSAERARVRALSEHHDGVYGVHLRTGAGNGWNDPMLDDWQSYDKVLDAAFSFAKDDGCVSPAFYFVSDSIEARKAVSQTDWPHPVVVDLLTPNHLDRSSNIDTYSNDLTYHEFQMLSEAKSIICGKGGFASIASLAGGTRVHRYMSQDS